MARGKWCPWRWSPVRTWSKFNLQRPLYEFHKNSLLTILWKVPHVIVPYAGRYEQHLTSAIPTGQWVSWRQFLDTPGSPARLWLYQFLTDSAKACNFGVDEKWCQDHHICSFMLHYALGRYCHVDDQHGLCKRELVWFQGQAVPPVQPPVPQAPAFPQAPSTTSKAKPPTPPEATKANGPSPAPAHPAPAPPAPATPAPAPPAPAPPPAAPEAQAEPRRSELVSRSRSRPPAKIPVKAKLDTGWWFQNERVWTFWNAQNQNSKWEDVRENPWESINFGIADFRTHPCFKVFIYPSVFGQTHLFLGGWNRHWGHVGALEGPHIRQGRDTSTCSGGRALAVCGRKEGSLQDLGWRCWGCSESAGGWCEAKNPQELIMKHQRVGVLISLKVVVIFGDCKKLYP